MLNNFAAELDIGDILQTLPYDVLEHMQHVKILVDAFCFEIEKSCLSSVEMSKESLGSFGPAAFYHDIGKALIPPLILTKQERLTPNEVFVIRKHPIYAKAIFENIRKNSLTDQINCPYEDAVLAAIYHHEWWNGNGYPYGIRKNDIPLIARITSICDAYDAITSERKYRVARSPGDACRELALFAGSQFDPELVRVFLNSQSIFRNLDFS